MRPDGGTGDPLHSYDVIGRRVRDAAGRDLGRVADVVLESGPEGPRVVEVLITKGPWGRLLGYERDQGAGPWPLSTLARRIVHRHTRTVPWADVTLD